MVSQSRSFSMALTAIPPPVRDRAGWGHRGSGLQVDAKCDPPIHRSAPSDPRTPSQPAAPRPPRPRFVRPCAWDSGVPYPSWPKLRLDPRGISRIKTGTWRRHLLWEHFTLPRGNSRYRPTVRTTRGHCQIGGWPSGVFRSERINTLLMSESDSNNGRSMPHPTPRGVIRAGEAAGQVAEDADARSGRAQAALPIDGNGSAGNERHIIR